MDIISVLFGLMCICYFVFLLVRKTEGKENEAEAADSSALEKPNSDFAPFDEEHCRKLCLETLRELNCMVHINEEGILDFSFQGYRFLIFTGRGFIRIVLPNWHEIDLDDIDQMSEARRIINEMNADSPLPCLIYNINKEVHKMFVSAITDTLFVKEIPGICSYLGTNLEWFFPKVLEFKNNISKKENVKL